MWRTEIRQRVEFLNKEMQPAMPITRPLTEIPPILCGPMLRGVTESSVSVFVALKDSAQVKLLLHDSPLPSSVVLGEVAEHTVALGKHLHVLLITLPLVQTSQLGPGKNYGYNLGFEFDYGMSSDLAALGLLAGADALSYSPGELPSFALPPIDLNDVRMVHGSCRKPHGEGTDMLCALDDIISKDIADPIKRPHILMLTGDQIYADDVSPPLLRTLHDTAKELLGWTEVFEKTAVDAVLGEYVLQFANKVKTFLDDRRDDTKPNMLPNPITEEYLKTYTDFLVYTKEELVTLQSKLLDLLKPEALFGTDFIESSFQKWALTFAAMIRAFNIRALNPSIITIDNWYDISPLLLGYRSLFENHLFTWSAISYPVTSTTEYASLTGLLPVILEDTEDLKFFLQSLHHALSPLASTRGWGHIDLTDSQSVEPSNWTYLLSRIAPPQRLNELHEYSGLSSDAMDAHLMFLGEFYMMYLFVWSDALWPRSSDHEPGDGTPPATPVAPEPTVATYKEAVPNYSLSFSQRAINEERENLRDFAKGLKKVRRALANVPVFMIFDDHEITDDWNLNKDWVRQVNARQMGSRILRNGLVAYAVFQDWGNQPGHYFESSISGGRAILNAIQLSGASPDMQPTLVSEPNKLDEVLRIGGHAEALINSETKLWDFAVNFYPSRQNSPCQILFLDTRTHRYFPNANDLQQEFSHIRSLMPGLVSVDPSLGEVVPPALLTINAMETQLTKRLSTSTLNIVVSPAPVFGVPAIEEVLQPTAVAATNPQTWDDEAWRANGTGFYELLSRLKEKNGVALQVVLLSGDVHYAFSGDIRFAPTDGSSDSVVAPAPDSRLIQLCSSSLKNETGATNGIGHIGHSNLTEGYSKLGSFGDALYDFSKGESRDFQADIHALYKDEFSGTPEHIPLLPFDGANGSALDRWWAETSSLFDPMARYLAIKNLSLMNVPNLLPGLLRAGPAGMLAMFNFQKNARGNGVFVNEKEIFTIQFLSHTTPGKNTSIVGTNNIGELQFEASFDPVSEKSKLQQLAHVLHWQSLETVTPTGPPPTIHKSSTKWHYIKQELARQAEIAYENWHTPGHPELIESDKRGLQLITLYHRFAKVGGPHVETGGNITWGGAFISYLITAANGEDLFERSARNITFIRAAKNNRIGDVRTNPFWLFSTAEKAPRVGDIVCMDRNALGRQLELNYDNVLANDNAFSNHPYLPKEYRPSRCDVVVKVDSNAKVIHTIGGNVGQTVAKTEIGINANGYIADGNYFGVIEVRTDLGPGD